MLKTINAHTVEAERETGIDTKLLLVHFDCSLFRRSDFCFLVNLIVFWTPHNAQTISIHFIS